MLGFIEVDLFTWNPAALTHLFKVNRICIKTMATISLRKIMDSLASFIFLPENTLNNTKSLQSDGSQQQL